MKPFIIALSLISIALPLKADSGESSFVEVVKKPSGARKIGQVIHRLTTIYAEIEENLRPQDKERILHLMKRGDFHQAVEEICLKLTDYQISLPCDLHQQIEELAMMMGIDNSLVDAIPITHDALFDDDNDVNR